MAGDKAGVINEYREAYHVLRAVLDRLSDAQMTKPFMDGWSVREVLAHILGWHQQLALGLERMAQGQRPVPEGVDWSDVQGWNDHFAREAAARPPHDLLQELDRATERFLKALEALPDDRFGEGKTANRIAANAGSEHFREHARDIEAALAAGKL
ncbi:MAG: hypothetical protein C4290_06255 [Chloroflexota bacterium]